MQSCKFINSNLADSEFDSITFYSCQLKEFSLVKASLENCEMIDTNFKVIEKGGLPLIIENSIIFQRSQS